MDYRNFSPGQHYCDESLQPQGPRRLKTSTPRGRRTNPYQRSPEAGPGGTESPPSEGHWNNSRRRSNDSWRSRDNSRNSSFNSSFNSPAGKSFSPGGFKQRYNKGFHRDQDFNSSSRNIAAYYDPSMMEDPWLELEQSNCSPTESITKQQNISSCSDGDHSGASLDDRVLNVSDVETPTQDTLIESSTECLLEPCGEDTSISNITNSQESVC